MWNFFRLRPLPLQFFNVRASFWIKLGLLLFLCAYLIMRRRISRKKLVLEELYRQGADDRATDHPFSLEAIHDVAISHGMERFEAHEAYRRGFVDTDSKYLLKDVGVLKTQLHRQEAQLSKTNAQHARNPSRSQEWLG